MKSIIRLSVLSAAVLAIAGCHSSVGSGSVSYGAVAGNLTPEMQTLAERPVDIDRHMAYAQNAEWRMFWSDIGRVFYTDHPSRLSSFPIAYTSGQPR